MYSRIKELCKEKGTTVAAIERACGFGNGSIRKWDNASPAYERVEAVAKYLGVDVIDISGEHKKPVNVSADGLGGTDYEKLTAENRALVDLLIAKLLKGQSAE